MTAEGSDGVRITLVDRIRTPWAEEPWLRFLMGPLAGETVKDADGSVVLPDSLVITQYPGAIGEQQLARIRATPRIGLFLISDEWYWQPIDAYAAFNWVWRQHFHSAISGNRIRTVPLGPACLGASGDDLDPGSTRALRERSIPISFAGALKSTRFGAARALATVPGSSVHISGRFDTAYASQDAVRYEDVLRDSVFVACPMGNVNLDSFRVYEALEAGAVPIVERRRGYDYFRAFLGPHPLPTVRRWSEAPDLVSRFVEPPHLEELQETTRNWWRRYKRDLCGAMRADVLGPPDERASLERRPGTLRLRGELLRHHNTVAWARRAQITALRLARRS